MKKNALFIHNETQEVTIREDGSLLIGTINVEPSMTHQMFREQCDINVIMRQYNNNYNALQNPTGQYLDQTLLPQDLMSAYQIIEDAQHAFAQLPALVRARFQNDPSEVLSFIQDEKNRDEAISLGLIPKPETNPLNQIQNDLNEIKTNTKTKPKSE